MSLAVRLLCGGLITLVVLASSTWADDRVTFAPEPGAAHITVIGDIKDYTGKVLQIQPRGTSPHSIPIDQIISIETFYAPPYRQGIALFDQGDIDAAEPLFDQALRTEGRPWVQREQYAWMMRCRHRRGDLSGVAEAFQKILATDAETRHWGMAPLIWSPTQLSTGQKAMAKTWLAGSFPPMRLIGASWLLDDPTFGEPARRGLDELARDTNPMVSQLSRIQLWRTQFATDLNGLTLAGWERDMEFVPSSLQAGPRYLIGRGYAQRQEYRQAAAAFLWLPVLYAEHEPLAAAACLEAGEALKRSGLTQEAENMYRELNIRYGWSPAARELRSRVNP